MPKTISKAKPADVLFLQDQVRNGRSLPTAVVKPALGRAGHGRLVVAIEQAPKTGEVVVLRAGRLSDPDRKRAVAKMLKTVSTDRNAALTFLQSIGVATAKGRLTKRYGG